MRSFSLHLQMTQSLFIHSISKGGKRLLLPQLPSGWLVCKVSHPEHSGSVVGYWATLSTIWATVALFSDPPSFMRVDLCALPLFVPLLVRAIIRGWGRFDTYRSGECCWVFVSWKSKSNLTVQNRAHAVSAGCNVKAHYSQSRGPERMTDYHSGQPRAPSTLTHSAVQDVPRTSCLYQQLF